LLFNRPRLSSRSALPHLSSRPERRRPLPARSGGTSPCCSTAPACHPDRSVGAFCRRVAEGPLLAFRPPLVPLYFSRPHPFANPPRPRRVPSPLRRPIPPLQIPNLVLTSAQHASPIAIRLEPPPPMPPPSFRTEQPDASSFHVRSRERIGLRREKSLFVLDQPSHPQQISAKENSPHPPQCRVILPRMTVPPQPVSHPERRRIPPPSPASRPQNSSPSPKKPQSPPPRLVPPSPSWTSRSCPLGNYRRHSRPPPRRTTPHRRQLHLLVVVVAGL
jgi:hypothetical protein